MNREGKGGVGILLLGTIVLAILRFPACGNSPETTITTGDSTNARQDTTDGDACRHQCERRECGPNGCGGSCGQCAILVEQCSDDGKCIPWPCTSSVDCPGDLVCDDLTGACVVCAGDEDCPTGSTCGPDATCHEELPCTSDKDCKAFEMVCDKEAGICVRCLKAEHCPEGTYCAQGFCLPVVCTPGDSMCGEGDVLTCNGDGSGWLSTSCGTTQYCEDSQCVDLACPPGTSWCDDSVYKKCSNDGKTVLAQEDCAAKGWNCVPTGCVEGICAPGATYCLDDFVLAECNADGTDFTSSPCPEAHYCQDEACQAQVCQPAVKFCLDNWVAECDEKGGDYSTTVDCADLLCLKGECADCQPQCEGMTCGSDGCGGSCGQCQQGQVCIGGQCPPEGMECDDGNAISWDGCTEGAVTEFLVSSEFQVVRSGPVVGVSYAGNILVAWAAYEQVLPGWEVFARVLGPDGQFLGPEFQVNTTTEGDQLGSVVAPLKSGGFVVLWSSRHDEEQTCNIFGQRLAEDGEKIGDEFQLTMGETANRLPRACGPLSNGGLVVVWDTYPNGDTSDGDNRVMALVLDEVCQPVTDEILISTHFAVGQPAVATYPEGSFAVVWDAKDDGGAWDIFAREIDPSGAPGQGPVMLSTSSSSCRSPYVAVDGESLQAWVVWRGSPPATVFGALLDSALVPLQQELKLSGMDEAAPTGALRLADGHLAIAWNDVPFPGGDVHLGIRTWIGEPVIEELTVNILTAGTQELGDLGLTTDGGIIAVWRGQLPGGGANSFGIYAQRFDSNGNRLYH